jgi:hypothetical protein
MPSPMPVPVLVALAAAAACTSGATARRPDAPPVAPPASQAQAPAAEMSAAPPAPGDEHAAADAKPSQGQAEPAQPAAPSDLLSEEQRAYEAAQPVFERYCTKCHTARGAQSRRSALRHLNMDTYPFGGHHAHEMGSTMRKILGATGEKPTMPRDKPGTVKGEDLALVIAWTEAFDRSHAAGLHKHHGQEGHERGREKTHLRSP